MPLSDYQLFWDTQHGGNITFGGSTFTNPGIDIVSIEGLFDHSVRDDDREDGFLAGDIPGIHRPAPRIIRLVLEIRGDPGDTDYTDLVQQVRYLFGPQYGTVPFLTGSLQWKWPGEPEKLIRARPIRRREPRNSGTEFGLVKMEIELKAGDPRIYSVELHSESDGSYNNAGNTWAYPKFTVTVGGGAIVDFTNTTNGLQFSGAFVDGSGSLIADFDSMVRNNNTQYIFRATDVDNYKNWDHPRRIIALDPGANTITFATGTLASVQWRDTWI